MLRACLAAVLLCVAVSALRAQPSYRFVTLMVTDQGTGAPLSGVQVTVQGVTDRSWTTDEKGMALVAVAAGNKGTLLLRRVGYSPITATPPAGTGAVTVPAAMTAAVHSLDTTQVVAVQRSDFLEGFERRRSRATGSASYFTSAQIEKMMAIRTIDVVRRAVGVKAIDSSGVLLIASSRGPKTIIGAQPLGGAKGSDLAPCVMRIAVDGMLREWGFSLDNIEPKEVHGVEVYPGPATIPSEFGGMRKDAMCGLVMIWTRRGP
jgi:hypothetical protein